MSQQEIFELKTAILRLQETIMQQNVLIDELERKLADNQLKSDAERTIQ